MDNALVQVPHSYPDDFPTSEFELTVRSANVLLSLGIRTVRQLRNIPDSQLRGNANCGLKSIAELRALVPFKPEPGYQWKQDRAWWWGIEYELQTPEMEWALTHQHLIRALLAGECELVIKNKVGA